MTRDQSTSVAVSWIWQQYHPQAFWPVQAAQPPDLWELVRNDPEIAWPILLLIHNLAQTSYLRGALSSGPIEDLLVLHGPAFIQRIESKAKSDPSFASMLEGVWKSDMLNHIWKRLNATRDPQIQHAGTDTTPGA